MEAWKKRHIKGYVTAKGTQTNSAMEDWKKRYIKGYGTAESIQTNRTTQKNAPTVPFDWNTSPQKYNPREIMGKDEIILPFGPSIDVNEYSQLVGYDATGKTVEQWTQETDNLETVVNAELRARGAVQWAESFGASDEQLDILRAQIKLPDDVYKALTAKLNQMKRVNLYSDLRNNEEFQETAARGASALAMDDIYRMVNDRKAFYTDTINQLSPHVLGPAVEQTLNKQPKIERSGGKLVPTAMPDSIVTKFDKLGFMTQDEINIYNYIYESKGKEAADTYIDFLDESLSTRASQEIVQQASRYAQAHPVFATLASPFYNAIGGIQSIPYLAQKYAANEEINPNNSAFGSSITRDTVRREVSKDMGWLGEMIYNAATSTADFLLLAGLGKGATLTTMGINATTSAIQDATARGADNRQALDYGLRVGLIEVLTENVGYDAIVKTWGAGRNGLKALGWQALKSLLPEGMEETTSGILDDWVDYIVMQDMSNWETRKRAYIAQGMTEAQAKARIIVESIGSYTEQGLTGAMSGAMAGGSGAFIQTIAGDYTIPGSGNNTETLSQTDQQNGTSRSAVLQALPVPENMEKQAPEATRKAETTQQKYLPRKMKDGGFIQVPVAKTQPWLPFKKADGTVVRQYFGKKPSRTISIYNNNGQIIGTKTFRSIGQLQQNIALPATYVDNSVRFVPVAELLGQNEISDEQAWQIARLLMTQVRGTDGRMVYVPDTSMYGVKGAFTDDINNGSIPGFWSRAFEVEGQDASIHSEATENMNANYQEDGSEEEVGNGKYEISEKRMNEIQDAYHRAMGLFPEGTIKTKRIIWEDVDQGNSDNPAGVRYSYNAQTGKYDSELVLYRCKWYDHNALESILHMPSNDPEMAILVHEFGHMALMELANDRIAEISSQLSGYGLKHLLRKKRFGIIQECYTQVFGNESFEEIINEIRAEISERALDPEELVPECMSNYFAGIKRSKIAEAITEYVLHLIGGM